MALTTPTTRRAVLLMPVASMPQVASAKLGVGANLGLPSQDEADGALGGKADTYGDASRANSLYRRQLEYTSDLVESKKRSLEASFKRLDAKLSPAVAKAAYPAIADALNLEAFTFKSLLSDLTKAKQEGKVCLVDVSQRGLTMPKGLDPSDCPLQLKQVAILQDINDLMLSAKTRDKSGASTYYAALAKDIDTFFRAL